MPNMIRKVIIGAKNELAKVRAEHLQERDQDKLESAPLIADMIDMIDKFDMFDITARVIIGLHDFVPITAVVSDVLSANVYDGWEAESGRKKYEEGRWSWQEPGRSAAIFEYIVKANSAGDLGSGKSEYVTKHMMELIKDYSGSDKIEQSLRASAKRTISAAQCAYHLVNAACRGNRLIMGKETGEGTMI